MHGSPDPFADLRDLGLRLSRPRLNSVVIQRAGLNLDRALLPLLSAIAESDHSVAELAANFGLDQSTVSRQLAKLEMLGLIERRLSPSDQRKRIASLTIEGRRTFERLEEARRSVRAEVLADWPDNDLRLLSELLRRLSEAFAKVADGPLTSIGDIPLHTGEGH